MAILRTHAPRCPKTGPCKCPFTLDFYPQGVSGPRRRIQFGTAKAAKEFEAATKVKVSRGEFIQPAKIPTFDAAAQTWFAGKATMHPATIGGYKVVLRHLAPLDPKKLDQISVSDIERLRDALLSKALKPYTVRQIMAVAAAVFENAVRLGQVARNPAASAQRPRNKVSELQDDDTGHGDDGIRLDQVFSGPEISRLIEATTPGIWHTLLATAASTGIRPEESLALAWADLELGDAPSITVRRSLSWARGADESSVAIRPKMFPPKTRAGYRTIAISPELASMLRTWKLACPPSPLDLVFPAPDGRPCRLSEVSRSAMAPACRRAGLRGLPFRMLRHSAASSWLAAGVPLLEVSSNLGHSNANVTLRCYAKGLPSTASGGIARVSQSFLGSGSGATVRKVVND